MANTKQHKLTIMDRSGDTAHTFKPDDQASVDAAMKVFDELVKKGHTAGKMVAPGKHELIRKFDPTAEETILFPRLQGG